MKDLLGDRASVLGSENEETQRTKQKDLKGKGRSSLQKMRTELGIKDGNRNKLSLVITSIALLVSAEGLNV